MKNLIWLASYPKSGNTWFRAFLSALQEGQKVNINKLSTATLGRRDMVDDALELESIYLTNSEIEALMPKYYRFMSKSQSTLTYSKTHDKYYCLPNGQMNIPEDATLKAIYFVRNPLEVAVSYAHHSAWSIDRTIVKMANDNAKINASVNSNQIAQYLGSWSEHVRSWINITQFPVLIVKYEEMLQDSINTFTRICHFLELEYSQQTIEKSIKVCSFEALQAQEKKSGFAEKNPHAQNFFRSGRCDSWKTILKQDQIKQIMSDHGSLMAQLGYGAE